MASGGCNGAGDSGGQEETTPSLSDLGGSEGGTVEVTGSTSSCRCDSEGEWFKVNLWGRTLMHSDCLTL